MKTKKEVYGLWSAVYGFFNYKLILFLFVVTANCKLETANCFAQDFHLTQFDAAPHYYNPAITGVYFGEQANYKIYGDYRSQWKAFGTKPYSTTYLAYDMPYNNWGKEFGVGGYLIHSRNGKGGLNTLNFMPSIAYKITNDVSGPHNLSVGLQMGILYKSFDPNNFTYDNQYNPDADGGFDVNTSSGENFEKTSWLKFDANMGVFYKYKKPEWKAQPWGGFSIYHATKPKQTFTNVTKDRMPMHFILQAGADYKINEDIKIIPSLLFMKQAKAYEFTIGSLGFYKMKETPYEIIGGLNYRWKDAFIIQAGMKYEQHIFKLSYDINTSYLNNYTNGRGAFEFSLVLTGINGKPLFNPKFFQGKGTNKSL
ncbi:MAG: PorP/SprF family type IX secretion system membrane protein [Bacteroidetes bacterium]|nr:PorP/SprF family type IX secretion system membrane protein [Bacteroidota bacterium]